MFRQLAPSQWQAAIQQISYSLGFGGDVTAVEVEDVENVDKPFYYSYDYSRKEYSDWAKHKITFPLPQLDFGPGVDADKPKEPFWAGEPGTSTYRASIHLPDGFTLSVPSDVSLTTDFADYSAYYSLKDGTFSCERKMTIKRSKVALEQWAAYQKFAKAAQIDQTSFVPLWEAGGANAGIRATWIAGAEISEAAALINQAWLAIGAQKLAEAGDLAAQAEKSNPKQQGLWALKGELATLSGKKDEAIAVYRKEFDLHPEEIPVYAPLALSLAMAGKRDEAIEVWRKGLDLDAANEGFAQQLVTLLVQSKRYAEIAPALEKSIAAAPGNYRIRELRVKGLLGTGDTARAVTEAQDIGRGTNDPGILNDLAYEVADSGVTTNSAIEWAQRAISQTEQDCAKVSLAALGPKALANAVMLAAEWDTLGWIYFKQGDVANAEKYVDAAWRLSQKAGVADHLGQIYQKQGKQTQAIHMWRLALAAQGNDEKAKELLREANASVIEPVVRGASSKQQPVSPEEELGRLRTIKLPTLSKDTPVADYFVVVSRQGVQEVEIASEGDAPTGVKEALRAASFDFIFPDEGTEKIARRGILSCSAYTNPNCQFTLIPLSITRSDGLRKSGAEANASTPASR